MNDIDKLRIMLPHWIEHNQSHGAEFSQWVDKLKDDTPEVADLLTQVITSLANTQSLLEKALIKAGGSPSSHALDHSDHAHGHHH